MVAGQRLLPENDPKRKVRISPLSVPRRSLHGEWSSSTVFVLALAGASIGFGNLWRFPALVAEHGGGTFLLLYGASLLLLVVPLLLAELLVGYSARQAPVFAYRGLATLYGVSPRWALGGWLALAGAVLMLALLSVLAGWAMGYLIRSLGGAVERLDIVDATVLFHSVARDPERALAWQTLFLVLMVLVVAAGLRRGVEPFVRFAVPLLLGGILMLLLSVIGLPHFSEVAQGLLRFDPAHLTPEAMLAALRQGFYSLVLGVGAVTAFAAYLPQRKSPVPGVLTVVALDTLVAVMAALVVLTLLAGSGMDIRSGPALLFEGLPMAISVQPGASYKAVLLYAVLVLAALTTAVALLEGVVAWLVERGGLRRPQAAVTAAAVVWLLGLTGMLSFSVISGWYPLAMVPGLETATLFDLLNRLGTQLILPLAALAAILFIGWAAPRESLLFALGAGDRQDLAGRLGGWLFGMCYLVIRFIAPVLLLLVMAHGLGFPLGANG